MALKVSIFMQESDLLIIKVGRMQKRKQKVNFFQTNKVQGTVYSLAENGASHALELRERDLAIILIWWRTKAQRKDKPI
jgi:hypothetical protein